MFRESQFKTCKHKGFWENYNSVTVQLQFGFRGGDTVQLQFSYGSNSFKTDSGSYTLKHNVCEVLCHESSLTLQGKSSKGGKGQGGGVGG